MTDEKTILVIDDDREIAGALQAVLSNNGYRVILAPNGVEGQRMIEFEKPDMVITDMMMPRMGGFPILEFLRQLENPPKVIMITANEGGRHKAYAEMLGVVDYLRKPFPMENLLDAVNRTLRPGDSADEAKGAKTRKAPVRKRPGASS